MHYLNRRNFLKTTGLGVGGMYLGGFMRSLEAANGGVKPARVVFFLAANGLYPNAIAPSGIPYPKRKGNQKAASNGALIDQTLDGQKLPFSLEPLQPNMKKVTYVHGLSGKVALHGHGTGFGALGCWPAQKKAYGTSIDAAIGQHLGGIHENICLGIHNKAMTVTFNVTSIRKGKPAPCILNPLLAHEQLFKAGMGGAAGKAFKGEKHLMEFMAKDVDYLRRQLAGPEKEKLDAYVEAFDGGL